MSDVASIWFYLLDEIRRIWLCCHYIPGSVTVAVLRKGCGVRRRPGVRKGAAPIRRGRIGAYPSQPLPESVFTFETNIRWLNRTKKIVGRRAREFHLKIFGKIKIKGPVPTGDREIRTSQTFVRLTTTFTSNVKCISHTPRSCIAKLRRVCLRKSQQNLIYGLNKKPCINQRTVVYWESYKLPKNGLSTVRKKKFFPHRGFIEGKTSREPPGDQTSSIEPHAGKMSVETPTI